MASGEATICGFCDELIYLNDGNWKLIEEYSRGDEEDIFYCHNEEWDIEGGTCWQKRVVIDFPEMEPWLWYGFGCAGCEGDENGECCCTNEDFLDP